MITKIKSIILSFAIIATPVLAVATPVAAADGDSCTQGNNFLPTWYSKVCKKDANGKEVVKSPKDMPGKDTAAQLSAWIVAIALSLVTILLTVVGYVSLGFIIYGGFQYMTSGDNSSGTLAARKTITNAVIGLVLSIMSVAIVSLVADAIQ